MPGSDKRRYAVLAAYLIGVVLSFGWETRVVRHIQDVPNEVGSVVIASLIAPFWPVWEPLHIAYLVFAED